MRRALLLLAMLPLGFGTAQLASSAPPWDFCERKPNHPKCKTTSGTTTAPPTTTTTPTTQPPPTTTTTPTTTTPPGGTDVANLWVAP